MTRYLDNHSDNLGDDEFETHSFSDEYSPTDGFTNRDHPREFYVQSPTSSSKDEEAAAESPAAASSSQHVVYDYRWSTLPPPRVPDERTPLMYEAPPAYSPPSSLYEQPSPRPENNLNPSSNALFPERAPESMGNPSDDAIEEFDMERQHRALEKTRISRLWSGTGRIVIIFVGILLLLLLLSKAFVGTSKSEKVRFHGFCTSDGRN